MLPAARNPAPRVELVSAARQQEAVLANLLELYIYDFSEFLPLELDAGGRFGYPPLPLYWSEPGRHPFLIYADSKLAGLALVTRGPEARHGNPAWDMAEFFIVRNSRRYGIGAVAAQQVWSRFPGLWTIRVRQANTKAVAFWQQAIDRFAGTPIEPAKALRDGGLWWVFTFQSAA